MSPVVTPSAAGRFRHRVKVRTRQAADSSPFGEPGSTLSAGVDRWAEVTPLSAEERMSDGGMASDVTHRVRMRPMEGLSSDDVIEFQGREFEIRGVVDVGEAGVELVVTCSERRALP